MNLANLYFYLVLVWICVALVWSSCPPRNKSFLERTFIHEANIGGGLGAGVGGALGASIGTFIGGESGAIIGGALIGSFGGAVGGFITGGPVGFLSGIVGGFVGSASGAAFGFRKSMTRKCTFLGKVAAARLGGMLGGAMGGFYGVGGKNGKQYIPWGSSVYGMLQISVSNKKN